jgi:hypothetical protein
MSDYEYELDGEDELLDSEEEQESDPELDEMDMEGEGSDQEMELAAELLAVSDEQELDQFVGKLFRRVGQAAKGILATPAGQQLKGMLRGTLKQALPLAGRAVGSFFGGSTGGDVGSNVASRAGQLFGLELEGLSPEDQELEVARRVVRMSTGAIRQLARTPRGGNPRQAAASAMSTSMRRYAPGMRRRRRGGGSGSRSGSAYGSGGSRSRFGPSSSGRWIRRNGQIVLLDF